MVELEAPSHGQEARMRRIALVLLVLLFGPAPAQAEAPRLQVGKLLVCDTAEQMKRFIELGATSEALVRVNAEAGKGELACWHIRIGFVAVETERVGGFNVIRVIVYGTADGGGVRLHKQSTVLFTISRPGVGV